MTRCGNEEDIFRAWDVNGDGEVSTEEFMQVLRDKFNYEFTDDQFLELFHMFDEDGDGRLTVEEVVSSVATEMDKITLTGEQLLSKYQFTKNIYY